MNIKNLKILFEEMSPFLHDHPYVFLSINKEELSKLTLEPLCYFHEQEGITIIIEESAALSNNLSYDNTWAFITLRVNSSLSAVGFIAVLASRLADAGISVNPVSAFYHDHLFVPWNQRNEAMLILQKISNSTKTDI